MADTDKFILIKRVMIDLEYVWTQNPDLRLGQLMETIYGCGVCMFNREDQVIADVIKAARERGLVSGVGSIGSNDGEGMV